MQQRTDLDRARREAKALLRAARAGDPSALARLRSRGEPRLADAQRAVAHELGARSWPALVARIGALGDELRQAAREGRAAEVYRLLEAGAPANARDPQSGATALHLAAAHGFLDVVDYLVGWLPVDKGARDAAGHTALAACLTGTADPLVAQVLVSVGLEPEPWMVDRAPEPLATWLRGRLVQPRADRDELPARFAEAAWRAGIALSTLIARSPLAETRPVGDGFAFVTGQSDNTRNGVVCSHLSEPEADREIASVLAWLREREVPAQWLVEAETEPADLRERLTSAGCRPERTAVHMAASLADLQLSSAAQPAELAIARITDAAGLAAAPDDPDDAQLWTSLGLDDRAPARHFAAQLGGRTVGAVSALIDGPTVAVIGLAVDAGERRRGIGRALLRHALREAAARGCTAVTVAPTPATVPFYETLGLALERYPPDRCYYTPL